MFADLSIVGGLATKKHIEDYSDGPNVTLLRVIATFNFGGAVLACAKDTVQMFVSYAPRGTKVGKFNELIVQWAEENVVWFYVTMHIPLRVEIAHRR